jgi:hypothetical protein
MIAMAASCLASSNEELVQAYIDRQNRGLDDQTNETTGQISIAQLKMIM